MKDGYIKGYFINLYNQMCALSGIAQWRAEWLQSSSVIRVTMKKSLSPWHKRGKNNDKKASILVSSQNVTLNKFDNRQPRISVQWICSYQLWAPPWTTSFSTRYFMWHIFVCVFCFHFSHSSWADQNIVVDSCCLCSQKDFLCNF